MERWLVCGENKIKWNCCIFLTALTIFFLQDPLVTKGPTLVPLLGIYIWEHAYYLQYENAREDYLKNIWKVICWSYANEVYKMECLCFGCSDNLFRFETTAFSIHGVIC
ncbi:superoxide dismutase [Striga asiatica]|uniref:superoxide dismutase n=1 Tax=Striga asiatica TaxID=4170 RepID=A0A5A7PCF8_STRAF|nr:superoxide dismutase [Striga asiatica]